MQCDKSEQNNSFHDTAYLSTHPEQKTGPLKPERKLFAIVSGCPLSDTKQNAVLNGLDKNKFQNSFISYYS